MKVKLRLSCSREMERKAVYVLSTFLDVLGVPIAKEGEDPRRCISIHYGDLSCAGREGDGIFIGASPEAQRFFSTPQTLNAGGVRKFSIRGFEDVPVLFCCGGEPGKEADNILPHDIVSSAFYFLSNWEEIGDDVRDPHGRYLYSRSPRAKLGQEGYPIVDTYILILKEMILAECRARRIEFSPPPVWPEGKEFALCLTHDVDCVRRYSLCSLRQKFPGFDSICFRHPLLWGLLYSGQRLFNPAINRLDPFWAFRDIMDLEREFGFRSSFYFQVSGGSPFDTACYRAEDGDILAVMEALQEDGFEVGLHGSYESSLKEGLIKEEVEKLESLAGGFRGHRQHYLRTDPHRSFGIYTRVGLEYDTTLGYADREGYKNGISFPFNPYDISMDRPYEILEIPLTVMDWTLEHYRHLSPSDAWSVLRSILETARGNGGCVCLLWHVHMFSSGPLRDLYRRALEWAAEHNAWGVPARSIYEWWVKRRRQYRITGPTPNRSHPRGGTGRSLPRGGQPLILEPDTLDRKSL